MSELSDIRRPAEIADGLRAWVRVRQSGGCRMISDGDACRCPLCAVDALVDQNARLQALLTEWLSAADECVTSDEMASMLRYATAVDAVRAALRGTEEP